MCIVIVLSYNAIGRMVITKNTIGRVLVLAMHPREEDEVVGRA